jgi:polysaccharide pyruvyl transferase WcaK-like protein
MKIAVQIASLFALWLCVGWACAQNLTDVRNYRDPHSFHRMTQLDADLTLSAAQKAAVQSIMEDSERQRESALAIHSNPAAAMAWMQSIGVTEHAKIRALLVPTQQAKYDAKYPVKP